METNQVLLWIVVLSVGSIIVQLLRLPNQKNKLGILAFPIIVLVLTGIFFLVQPDSAGWWSGLVCLLLLIVPSLGLRWLGRLVRRGQYQKAVALASFVRWLHPFSGGWQLPQIFQALHLLQQGELAPAEEIITKYRLSQSVWADVAWALFLLASRRYAELLAWLKEDIGLERLTQRPDLIRPYLSALAEKGDIEAMVAEYFRLKGSLKHQAYTAHLLLLRLSLFAYTKRLAIVERILNEYLADIPTDMQRYWRATAMSWSAEDAQVVFRQLEHSQIYALRVGAASRLADAASEKPVQLTVECSQMLADEEKEVEESLHIKASSKAFRGERKPWVSWFLILAMVGSFVVFELLPGGEYSPDHLFKMGAMVSRPYLNGEWWRLLTSLFLHLGWLHLVFNAYALLLLGPFVERKLRIWRFVFLYFFCGILAMWISALTSVPRLIIGASGSIMGLLGATGAIMLQQFRKRRSSVTRKFLWNVLLVLVLQTTFDILTPNVSMTAHLSGFFAGFLVALLFLNLAGD